MKHIHNSFNAFKINYLNLKEETTSILKLMLFYNFSTIILNSFIGVIIYQETKSLESLLIYSLIMVFFTGLSLTTFGMLSSKYKISLKISYYLSIIINTFSYIYLIINHINVIDFYIFGVLQGLSIGFYWLSLLTYEMTHTHNGNRDFYSSVLSIGNQILKIIVPLISIGVFYLSVMFFSNEFELLFYIVPIIYIFSLIPLIGIKDFEAQPIYFKKLKLNTSEVKIISLYTFFDSFKFGNLIVLNSYISFVALKSLFNVGLFVFGIAIISLVLTFFLSNVRNTDNRIKLMFISLFGIFLAYLPFLFFPINIYVYAFSSFILILFMPLYEITSKVIHLLSMDKLIIEGSFYTGMIYRSFILWFGRVFSLLIFIFLINFISNELTVIKIMIITLLLSYLMEYILVKKILKLP